jgi:histone deacetylase 1/2
VFHQFQVLVVRQFSHKIKSVQTDWGGEYCKLNSFFKTIGIHHHIKCPYTQEQNGTVKRRHRHIVEIGLTLLCHCKAPLKLWNCAFKIYVYLINCMLTSVLQNKSPFQCSFHQPPDYSFLRTNPPPTPMSHLPSLIYFPSQHPSDTQTSPHNPRSPYHQL